MVEKDDGPNLNKAPEVDHRIVAETLARVNAVVAGNDFDELLVDTFQQMTQEEAETFCDALTACAVAITGNM